jgi:hypothetical protein
VPAWPGEGALSGEGWAFSFPVQHSTWRMSCLIHAAFVTRGAGTRHALLITLLIQQKKTQGNNNESHRRCCSAGQNLIHQT